MAAVVSAAMFNGSTYATERLALAELELARVEAACRFDSCGLDCRVRESVRRSVESERANTAHVRYSEVVGRVPTGHHQVGVADLQGIV